MVSANTLCKKLLNVKHAVVEDANFYLDQMMSAISGSMLGLINGIRMIVHSTTDAVLVTTRRSIRHVLGEALILGAILVEVEA